mmetsp:Transcript_36203/g.87634  ORF Transcript_36203/g.87634 Transcript_36203/m.87634 type:complete len:259 (+) Transcript_36203:647-1423(+)
MFVLDALGRTEDMSNSVTVTQTKSHTKGKEIVQPHPIVRGGHLGQVLFAIGNSLGSLEDQIRQTGSFSNFGGRIPQGIDHCAAHWFSPMHGRNGPHATGRQERIHTIQQWIYFGTSNGSNQLTGFWMRSPIGIKSRKWCLLFLEWPWNTTILVRCFWILGILKHGCHDAWVQPLIGGIHGTRHESNTASRIRIIGHGFGHDIRWQGIRNACRGSLAQRHIAGTNLVGTLHHLGDSDSGRCINDRSRSVTAHLFLATNA